MRDRLAFVEAHPAPDAPVEKAAFLLGSLCRPDAVIDLAPGGSRAFLGVVIDTCENAEDEAIVEVLGIDPARCDEAVLREAIASAERIAGAGPRSRLAVVVPGVFAAELLGAAGFAPAWRSYAMERPDLPVPPIATPPGLRWIDADRSWAAALDAALRPAMGSVPGSFVPPLETLAERLESQPIATRILVRGDDEVAAFVRPEVHGDGGFIGILGRAPWARGLGLGAVALREGMRVLRSLGCGAIGLEVAARNERALRLYREEGFAVGRVSETWAKPIRWAGSAAVPPGSAGQ